MGRLRRWYRDLKSRDVLELPEALTADEHLRDCTAVFDEYADGVYAILHVPPGPALSGAGQ